MLVTLIGKNTIHKLILPKIVVGNYWISDKSGEKEKKLINIHSMQGEWIITSNDFAKVIDLKENKVVESVSLKINKFYGIRLGNLNELFILSCTPRIENYTNLSIRHTSEIYIGKGVNNHISYKNNLIAEKHARIYMNNERWIIENFDSNFGTFVNNKPVFSSGTILSNGDVIYIMGLKIIIIDKSIFINDKGNAITYDDTVFIPVKKKEHILEDNDKEEEIELYSEKDYFYRAPRITNKIECEKVKIDAPPQMQDKEEMPLILTIGTSLSMGTMMMVSVIRAIDSNVNGTSTVKQMLFSLIPALAMLICMVLFPILTVKYNKNKKKRYEEKRQKRYKEYLDQKSESINRIMNKQRNILFENNVSAEECSKIILSRGSRLWERRIEDYDFLSVRLGIGDVPLNIDIQYPEEKFRMEDDNLIEILNSIADNSKTIKAAPISTSLVERNISALIIQEENEMKKFMQSLIIQLIAFHSYEDLKLVFFLKEDKNENWEYVKMLPHVWDNTKQIRFFADDYDDMKEISKYLEEEFQNRSAYVDKNYKSFAPYYLIITDDHKKIESLKIITEILKMKTNIGFSILYITNDLTQLPNECKTFINFDNVKGTIFENEISSNTKKDLVFDTSVTFFFEKICKTIANIPIKYTSSAANILPSNYTFLEMYDVGCIEQLNILERWNKNDTTRSLKALIGIDNIGMPIALDIHEKFHGPHGLIAGSTGSGKSEFIITYILSLAINYHPNDLSFVLIDYKGGGLAGAFQKKNIKIPHLVGTITNIDTNGLQRSLASIQSELKRRQIIFNEARNVTDEGTIDIYKYQKLYHDGIVKLAVPHLLIICDEFAELKQQQPEFMEELMSVSRIGRSLGVHLILATQKPAGIVNDQIRSNSKFAVCLRVQDRQDSNDVIKRPDAASLKKAGQFYMQVGNDEYFVMGQSAWSGAPYFPSDITEKKVDNSVEFISNIGVTIKKLNDTTQKVISSQGEQLTNIVKYICGISKDNNITSKNLWLESIPENIYLENLRSKYKVDNEINIIEPVIGEYDDPYNQRQNIVKFNLSDNENILVFGNAESGKETLLSTMIYDLITTHSSEEVQLYILDFGSEALKIYNGAPHVGDIIFANDIEKTERFFNMIKKEIQNRKAILSDYNGDYKLYLKDNKKMPMLVVVINNYETFSELYKDKYEEVFLSITREGLKYGIVFVVAASSYSDMRYRSSQNFKKKIALQLNKDDEYYNIIEKVGKKRPAHIFGRGLINMSGDQVYEFQTAKICEPEQYNIHVREVVNKVREENDIKARPVPVLPSKISIEDVKTNIKDLSAVPIGITKREIEIYNYNFKKNFVNIITSRNLEDIVEFVNNMLEIFKQVKGLKVIILDGEKAINKNIQEEYAKLNYELIKNNSDVLCIIIGLDKVIETMSTYEKNLSMLFKAAEENKKCNFIIAENANKIKNHEYDDWYKKYISKENGIWIGTGVDNQYLITITSDRKLITNNCGRTFGYAIKQGNATQIKFVGMMEEVESSG